MIRRLLRLIAGRCPECGGVLLVNRDPDVPPDRHHPWRCHACDRETG